MDFRLALLESITNNFSEEQKIGSGGYGDSYRAVHNGEEIAVKKLHQLQGLDDKQFHNEIRSLTKISHKNVIRLIGYCYESRSKYIEHRGERVFAKTMERLLCFEYMQGGSLDKYIADGPCDLDWPTCYKIIQGTCEGLNHLHNAHEKAIFHLDLKPSNILLDKNMTPKIADLGLSRNVASARSQQTEMRDGTRGYMPPEYIERGIISNKFDVFSLGVIILRMMAGNILYFHHSTKSRDQCIELVTENWKERLQTMSEHSSYHVRILQVRRCVEIALRCVDTNRTKRPTIKDIIDELGEPNPEINKIMSLYPNHEANWVGEMHSNMDFTVALIETMTNNFSADQKIGSGGYGDVYKAVHNGKEIAVKRLHPLQGIDDKELDSKLRYLSKISHQNVAQLIGYCYESRNKRMEHNGELVFHQMTVRIICFEYANGASLDRYISDESCGLDWPTCYDIITGTCEGLNHLHNGHGEPIFHLDLKPSNILLDKGMMPKIADAGLSRLLALSHTHKIEILEGTLDYMPPEYLSRGLISEKFDVFSLGVIIIKIIAGNMGFPRSSEMSSYQFIALVTENWKKRLQPMSGRSSYEIEILQQVRTCVEIALRCVDADQNKRPSIKEIIQELGIKTIISLPTEHKSISFVPNSQSSSSPAPDQPRDLIETEIKTNQTEAEIKINRTEAEIKIMLSVPPDQSGLDSQLCSTTAPDYSKDQIEAEIETIMSLPPDHKSYWSGLGSQSPSVTDRSKDLILQTGSKLQHLPLQYLKDITNNFCDERILGRGGFGVVYMGVLQNGKNIAVKKLLKAMPISLGQFENEVNLLMNLKHPNIVRLVGYCYETQHLPMPHEGKIFFDWKTESLLCLECLPNGSLDKRISGASSGLDWATRWKLIEGISYGLQYLHEQSKNPILHLDLKPANILLDENMLPKITDFGLSRWIDQEQTIYTKNMGGTIGYMPPEYLRLVITPKSDIFSLGVIIMEIITGHKNYPDNIKASSHDFIERELQEWRNRLQKEPGYASLEPDCQQIERCIQIGLICVNPDRTKRPTMKKIIDMLEGLESMNWYIRNELSNLAIQEEA